VFSDPDARMNLLGRLDTLPVENTSRAEAAAFCAWDGGRYLPSLAQWEKAARGPAPRTNQYPWDSGAVCDHLFAESCGWALRPGFTRIGVPYDSLPGTRGYYGTEVQVGGPAEWVRDVWFFGWYADASSFGPDPIGTTGRMTAMSPGRVLGGGRSISYVTEFGTMPTEVGFQATFRCARAAPVP
jgi:formylglycine-generating enzyme required for sulfatase activity